MLRLGSVLLVILWAALPLAGAPGVPSLARHGGVHHPSARRHAARVHDVRLLGNGGFEDGSLSPWRRGGSILPGIVTVPRHGGAHAALIGRLRTGPVATSTLTLRVPIPAHVVGARLTLYAWQQCVSPHPRSRLTVTVATVPRRLHSAPPRELWRGCGLSTSWTRLSADLAPAIGRSIVITAEADVPADEIAGLVLDDVGVTATVPFTPVAAITATATTTTTLTPNATARATISGTATLTAAAGATATLPLSGTAVASGTVVAMTSVTATATPTDVPNICLAPDIATAYAAQLPTMSPTATTRPTFSPTATPTGTLNPTATLRPTATAVWWHTPTPTPSATPTYGPTPGYTMTPGPSPTVGTACHAVDKGISYGFVSQDGGVGSGATPVAGPADAAALQGSGARSVRFDFHLVHDDSWTPREYAAYDQAVDAFRAGGLDVLGEVGPGAVSTIYQPNAWLANSMERSGGNGDNTFLHTFAARVLDLVGHFHGRINTWELWNEPNVGAAGMTGTYMYPSNFAAMLADVYALVKASYPDVTLVSGGILSDDDAGHSNPRNAGADYLRQTYVMGLQVTHTWGGVRAQLGTDPLDAVGQHLYLDQNGLVYTRHILDAYQWMHDAYGAFGDGAKPLYVTEAGWSTALVNPEQQALDLDVLYALSRNPVVPYVQRVYWYLLRDGRDPDQSYGLQYLNGQPKPAYYRYASY